MKSVTSHFHISGNILGLAGGVYLPKAGFKSITVHENIYERFFDVYQKRKEDLALRGVNSFAGYITYVLEDVMTKDATFAKYCPKLERISFDTGRIILKDNIRDRIIEILIIANELNCLFCESSSCIHVGFCYDMPEIYDIIGNKAKR